MDLNIISYNCRSARLHSELIRLLAEKCDVLFLQETLLNDENVDVLDTIDGFNFAHTPSFRRSDTFVGRSSGGLVVMWKNFVQIKFIPFHYNERIMGLKIHVNELIYLMINVYCVYDHGDVESMVQYMDTYAELSNIISDESCTQTIIAGDFNCDPNKHPRFFNEFSNFSNEHGMHMCDINNLPADSYTYVSDNNVSSTSTTCWLQIRR